MDSEQRFRTARVPLCLLTFIGIPQSFKLMVVVSPAFFIVAVGLKQRQICRTIYLALAAHDRLAVAINSFRPMLFKLTPIELRGNY